MTLPSAPNPYLTESMRDISRELHASEDVPGPMRQAICALIDGGSHTAARIDTILTSLAEGRVIHQTMLERMHGLDGGLTAVGQRVGTVEHTLQTLVTGKVNTLEHAMAAVQHDMKVQRLEMEKVMDEKLKGITAAYDEKLKAAATVQDKAKDEINDLKTEKAVQQGQLKLMYVAVSLLLAILGVVAAFLALKGETKHDPYASPTPAVAPKTP